MAHTVTEHDLRAIVEIIDHARHDTASCGLPTSVLELVQRLIASDLVSFCEMEPGARRDVLVQDSISGPLFGVDECDPDSDPFWVHYWDSKPCSYPNTSGDQRTITTISDFYSQRQWHETGMYRECVRGVEHEAMMCLSAPPGRSRRLILFRSGNHDFGGRDRLILTLLLSGVDRTCDRHRPRVTNQNRDSRQPGQRADAHVNLRVGYHSASPRPV